MTQSPSIPLKPFASSPTTRTRWIPEIDSHMRPSFERMIKDLRLVARARSEGEENRPLTSDADLDEPQRQVVAYVQGGVNLLKQRLFSQLHDAELKIHARRPRIVDTDLATSEARAGAAKAKQAAAEELETARLSERLHLRGFRKFRRDNNISRKAVYANEASLPAVLLAGMVFADAAGNCLLFMNATDGGLASALVLAAVCSGVTVALGFIGGFVGLRLLGHAKPVCKVVGGAALLTCLATGAYWNLTVARFRDALAHGGQSASFLATATSTPASGWFSHTSLESLGLILLGAIIFLAALLKGRGGRGGLTDPYWGYKPVDYAHRESDDVYKQRKDDYRAAVAAAYERARTSVRALHSANEADIRVIRETAEQADERAAEVRDTINEWIAMGGAALRKFREENLAVRTDSPPSYFGDYPSFAELVHDLPGADAVRGVAQDAINAHDAAGQALAAFERTLIDQTHGETGTFLAEIADIENRVDERIKRDWSDDDAFPANRTAAAPVLREVA